MGGYVGERIKGTEWARKNERIQAQGIYAREAAETGMHWGKQTGILKDKWDQEMTNTADAFSRSDLNISNWGKKPEEEADVQTSSANYTASSGTQKSSSGGKGGGKLTSTSKKKGRGKKDLTITKS